MEVLGLVLLVIVSAVTFLSLLAALGLLLPDPVERARQKLEANLVRSFLVGLVNLIFALALVGGLGTLINLFPVRTGFSLAGFLTLLVVLVAGTFIVLSIFGLLVLSTFLGLKIDPNQTNFWTPVRGGLLLVLAGLTPYLGWFVFTPFAICTGLGATILTLFRRKPANRPEEKAVR